MNQNTASPVAEQSVEANLVIKKRDRPVDSSMVGIIDETAVSEKACQPTDNQTIPPITVNAKGSHLYQFMLRHWILSFILFCLSGLVFLYLSYDLYLMMVANLNFISKYGYTAIEFGAHKQLVGLVFSCIGAGIAYITIKFFERVLVDKIANTSSND